jgi:hypothetical protein
MRQPVRRSISLTNSSNTPRTFANIFISTPVSPGETDIAVYCPTTLYRLGSDLKPTIDSARQLRDLCDYDVLDELLIDDGALNEKYKMLVMFSGRHRRAAGLGQDHETGCSKGGCWCCWESRM